MEDRSCCLPRYLSGQVVAGSIPTGPTNSSPGAYIGRIERKLGAPDSPDIYRGRRWLVRSQQGPQNSSPGAYIGRIERKLGAPDSPDIYRGRWSLVRSQQGPQILPLART